mmetsp:Transcript_11520/g.38082  ORF Transcript_11520/g.38082 Transcript_11520/m.38082 type:complete len:222 (+) Transcript_11520:884-1549(+)
MCSVVNALPWWPACATSRRSGISHRPSSFKLPLNTTAVKVESLLVRKWCVSSHVGWSADFEVNEILRETLVLSCTMYREDVRMGICGKDTPLFFFEKESRDPDPALIPDPLNLPRSENPAPLMFVTLIIPLDGFSTPPLSIMGIVIFAGYTSMGDTNFHSTNLKTECMPGRDIRSIPGGTVSPKSACSGSDISETSSPPRHGNFATSGVKVTLRFARSCRS